jgi:RimJ/RimL family protein N-acetyltransferase
LTKLILDKWLSELIGKQTYILHLTENRITKKILPTGKSFIWTKIPVDNITGLINLQKIGFYIVDTNIQLSMNKNINNTNDNKIRFAKPEDEQIIRLLARHAFSYNRFQVDPNISERIALKIKEEWVGNYFSGKRGKWMVVIEQNGKVVGFLLIIQKNQNNIIIDLIAVDKEKRGRGLAKAMISFAFLNCLGNIGVVEVGTQIANTVSLALYTKLGFNVTGAFYVLHRH